MNEDKLKQNYDVREKLIVALDFDSQMKAMKFVSTVQDKIKVLKVGLELYSVAGPDLVAKLIDMGFDVFVDLKLHDIPNTVNKAAKVLGRMGVKYATAHAAGGKEMLVSANEGFLEGRTDAKLKGDCYMLGVSVLTSDLGHSVDLLISRVKEIEDARLSGLVCSGVDLNILKSAGNRMFKVVPGIRPPGSSKDDQIRVVTPNEAIQMGADMIVVGRPITAAKNPSAVIDSILDSISNAS
jgi:orotidine-5'-phosphate decarboxylase